MERWLAYFANQLSDDAERLAYINRELAILDYIHRRRFPCDPRYFMDYVRQIFA